MDISFLIKINLAKSSKFKTFCKDVVTHRHSSYTLESRLDRNQNFTA